MWRSQEPSSLNEGRIFANDRDNANRYKSLINPILTDGKPSFGPPPSESVHPTRTCFSATGTCPDSHLPPAGTCRDWRLPDRHLPSPAPDQTGDHEQQIADDRLEMRTCDPSRRLKLASNHGSCGRPCLGAGMRIPFRGEQGCFTRSAKEGESVLKRKSIRTKLVVAFDALVRDRVASRLQWILGVAPLPAIRHGDHASGDGIGTCPRALSKGNGASENELTYSDVEP